MPQIHSDFISDVLDASVGSLLTLSPPDFLHFLVTLYQHRPTTCTPPSICTYMVGLMEWVLCHFLLSLCVLLLGNLSIMVGAAVNTGGWFPNLAPSPNPFSEMWMHTHTSLPDILALISPSDLKVNMLKWSQGVLQLQQLKQDLSSLTGNQTHTCENIKS